VLGPFASPPRLLTEPPPGVKSARLAGRSPRDSRLRLLLPRRRARQPAGSRPPHDRPPDADLGCVIRVHRTTRYGIARSGPFSGSRRPSNCRSPAERRTANSGRQPSAGVEFRGLGNARQGAVTKSWELTWLAPIPYLFRRARRDARSATRWCRRVVSSLASIGLPERLLRGRCSRTSSIAVARCGRLRVTRTTESAARDCVI
jgi:hypothetical protein